MRWERGGREGPGLGAVGLVVQRRIARHWLMLTLAGVLLGIGFGLCLASFAAARRTQTAYDRILVAADAPDAAVQLGSEPEEAERVLDRLDAITRQRAYVGWVGVAEGVPAIATAAMIAPIHSEFPVELPTVHEGRLPAPDSTDEVFVAASAAEAGDLRVGQRLHFHFVDPLTGQQDDPEATIVGIGSVPSEVVVDETTVFGVMVFSHGFYEAHRDLAVYSVSNVDLAPGVDARGEFAASIGDLGYELQSDRRQERQSVTDALRPLIIVVLAMGVLAFAATAVAAGQVVQRNRARWRGDDQTLLTLGMTGWHLRTVELVTTGVIAGLAVCTALATMVLLSPTAPIGPLHPFDPAQGYALDAMVAAIGSAIIVVTFAALATVFSSARRQAPRTVSSRSPWLLRLSRSPAAFAGLTLAWRGDDGRSRAWRGMVATTVAAIVLALGGTFVASATGLSDTPEHYGLDADLIAINAYGDQSRSDLERAFGDRDDVEAATGYTAGAFLVEGRAVPGLASTHIKGDLSPTVMRGRAPRSRDEIVLGSETIESIGADVGDVVTVQLVTSPGGFDEPDSEVGEPLDLTIVGVVTFPAVNQLGTDLPRLGSGALVMRDAFLEMNGSIDDTTEFTAVRMVEGADPESVIADNPDGFEDRSDTETSWFDDAKPAELRQLDAAMPYLGGALLIGYSILLAVIVHALWTRTRSNRHNLAVLRALGSTGGQLDAVSAWQAAPLAFGAVVFGIPIGIVLGRRAFTVFAESLAVVDAATTTIAVVAALVAAVLVAAAIGAVAAVVAARRTPAAVTLREA
ncbi:MAG TPA: FtsX-like permease family protein [Microthrixaceae bacterium]|nr:FtsX-like permease family protein [Microthrixaceae bacterium]